MAKIIVDIDNTLWDLAPVLHEYLSEEGPVPPIEKWGAWKFWEGATSTRTFYRTLKRIHMTQERFTPYGDAQWFLQSLKERGFRVVIASHREKDTYEPTLRWLEKYGLYFDELHVLNDKARLFDGAFGVVDDSPITLAKAVKAGIVATGLLFPWNEDLGYDLFKTLPEVLAYIDEVRLKTHENTETSPRERSGSQGEDASGKDG